MKGRFGHPDCLGIYDTKSTGPQAIIIKGYVKSPSDHYDYNYGYNRHRDSFSIKEKRSTYYKAMASNGQFFGATTVSGAEALDLGKSVVSAVIVDKESVSLDYKMMATLDDFCICCERQSSSFKCYSFNKNSDELVLKSASGPGFAVDESSFLVGTETGIYSVRTDYHVDLMEAISKPWKNVRSSSFSLMDKFGSLRCVAKLNETTLVGLSAKKSQHSSTYENLIILFFETRESRWKPGKRISNDVNNIQGILNCQVHGENSLLLEMTRSTNYESVYFYSIDIMTGLDWDLDWYGIKSDFDPSYGTLARFNDGLLYAGGVSNKDSSALLYKHKDSKKWVKLNQRLNEERVKPGVCIFKHSS